MKTSGAATLALAAGILSFVCMFGLGGLLAIALGWIAHNEIERSEGRLSGKGLASAGIGLGIANLVATVVGVGVLVALAVRPDPSVAVAPLRPAPVLPAPVPVAPPSVVPAPRHTEVAEAAPALPVLAPRVGKISIVEADASSDTLEALLLAQLQETSKSGEQLVLWTVTPDCEPCEAVGRALPDARMQRALSKVRLVRADAASFSGELQRLGVPIESVPGFTLFDPHAHPLDHIHGGEWDADIPANIAPILDKFLRRSLSTRRHPWTRPLRDGETPL